MIANDGLHSVDALKIKIDEAKAKLPADTRNAINAVDWRAAILKFRETKGYDFEQLGDLELQTELLLCGLLNPGDYVKKIEEKMHISSQAAQELMHEMNDIVFKKIKEEMIQITERKKAARKEEVVQEVTPQEINIHTNDRDVLESTGITINPVVRTNDEEEIKIKRATTEEREDTLKRVENPETTPVNSNLNTVGTKIHPLIGDKMIGSVQTGVSRTEYAVGKKEVNQEERGKIIETSYPPNADPYRLPPIE